MGKVTAQLSMSVDGYIAGPNITPENPMGDGGEELHEWVFGLKSWREPQGLEGGDEGPDDEVSKENFENKGAVVMGRTMFDLGEIPWGENPPYHNPVFVVTHRPKETIVKQGGTSYTFVPDFETAMDRAREAAGDKDISIAGGANVVQQAIEAGVLDEIDVHIAPRFLGGGTRLFDNLDPRGKFEIVRVIGSPEITHVKYRIGGRGAV
ncbi:MAG TPA: dihydrofolate reductase family protein [Actinomycetota bacterium]|jgi:dihydrofolate reductase|nr:dihydrofolate reductase family protein [Actinomycetota bacterium]